MNVIVYSRHRLTAWWRALVPQLSFVSDALVVSEFRGDGDTYVMPALYRHLDAISDPSELPDGVSEATRYEIVQRCRFLRQLEPALAARLVTAMWRTLEAVVDDARPDAAISLCIDYYAVDIFERLLRARRIPFLGLTPSPISGQTLISARGEHNAVRTPHEDEVEAALGEIRGPEFAPWLPTGSKYDLAMFLRRYAYYTARWGAFRSIALWKRDPLNFHYWLARAGMGYRVRLRDYGALAYLDRDWQARIDGTPPERRIFMPLGVHPESTIDYWVHDLQLLDHVEVIHEVANAFADAGYCVLVKDHPNMFAFRAREELERLARTPGVVLVPYDVPASMLINESSCTFTFGGTVGLQTALAGRCAIVTDPYYYVPGHFVRLAGRSTIGDLPAEVEGFERPASREMAARAVVRHVLRTNVPGNLIESWQGFRREGAEAPAVRHLAEGLNAYMPDYFARPPGATAPPADPSEASA